MPKKTDGHSREQSHAEGWLRKHGGKLPDMRSGSRIGGDPILYVGILEHWIGKGYESAIVELNGSSGQPERVPLHKLIWIIAPAKLTWRQVRIVHLRALGLTQAEIAERVGLSQQAVSKSLRQSRKKIQKYLRIG